MSAGSANHTFFLNMIVLNKDEVVEQQVSERMKGGGLGMGLARKAATAVAKRAVTDEKVGQKVGTELLSKLPGILAGLGINIKLTQRYVGGPLIVLRCEINEVDGASLVRKAKGEEAAQHFTNMTEAFTALGIEAGSQQVRSAVFTKTKDALMEKLSDVLPAKLLEAAGVKVDAICNDEATEAEWFFSFIENISLPAATIS
mmetsp:Transcript_36346/g.95842  ORF Transcript_36346/g.95842 Transcript_36346/m.95842 type:complete len:201 (+) Transcript_36346:87-689(+)|eukprot:CAMPEP_0115832108 /NCGR_PEP_ID=MMETSP0287-20121206/2486_1 /TAXON_ID=412157 /ORGANISM="Chrysochromulina rotalis, Strain UIO044" /LENGTH=200 /DNA_ID=CAMNT_0003285479 /DNA_START=72 /DNA_END=674 /DNA_ORIENTATION=+